MVLPGVPGASGTTASFPRDVRGIKRLEHVVRHAPRPRSRYRLIRRADSGHLSTQAAPRARLADERTLCARANVLGSEVSWGLKRRFARTARGRLGTSPPFGRLATCSGPPTGRRLRWYVGAGALTLLVLFGLGLALAILLGRGDSTPHSFRVLRRLVWALFSARPSPFHRERSTLRSERARSGFLGSDG
jgi:hypothetical protein